MVVDGVGSYATDIAEEGHRIDNLSPLARESRATTGSKARRSSR